MLTIEVANNKLYTAGDFSCRINVKNPAWRFDSIPGALAVDIILPAEDNAGLLKHPNRVTKRGTQNDRHFTNAVLKHNGVPFIKGDFVVTQATDTISAWIQSHLGKLGEEMREKSLRELSILPNQTFSNKSTFDPDTDFWCTIKLMNRGFWKDKGKMSEKNTDTEELTEKFERKAGFYINQDGAGGVLTSADTSGVVVVSPFPFLHWLIDRVLRTNQFYVSDNFLKTDADLKKLCLYTNYSIVVDDTISQSTEVKFSHFFWNYDEIIDVNKISSATWELGSFNLSDLLPDIKLKDLMLGIQNTWNVFFWPKNNRTMQIIDRDSIFSMEPFDLGNFRVTDWEIGERRDKTLKFSWEHDGNDSAFNDEFQDLDEKRSRILDSVEMRSDLYVAELPRENGDIRLVESENRYYEYGWFTLSELNPQSNSEVEELDAKGWKPVSIGLQNYFFNDGDKEVEEIKSIFSTLRVSDQGYPVVYQNGNSKTFSSVNEGFSPRLMFYRGNNTGGDESESGQRIDWKGDDGILYNRWKLTAPFYANALPLTAQFRLPTNVLKFVIENMYRPFSDPECRFVIDELDAEPGPNDETLTKIQAYKIEDNFWAYNPGTVPGGGEGTQTTFTPKWVGVTKYGQPYLIEADGNYRKSPGFETISSADYAHNCAVDYDPTTKQLVIGGEDGFIYIYDLSSNFRMNAVRVINSSDSVSAIKIIDGNIFVGRNNSKYFYVLPQESNIDDYTDFSSTAVELSNGYLARDFVEADGNYYCCTQAGEVFKGTGPTTGWTQLFDVGADFIRMAVTTSRIYVFSDSDRPFYCLRFDTTNWIEFRMTDSQVDPPIIETATSGKQVTALGRAYLNNVFMLDGPASEDQNIYSIGAILKGVVYDEADIYICGEVIPTYTGRMYKFTGTAFEDLFNLPLAMKILLF